MYSYSAWTILHCLQRIDGPVHLSVVQSRQYDPWNPDVADLYGTESLCVCFGLKVLSELCTVLTFSVQDRGRARASVKR